MDSFHEQMEEYSFPYYEPKDIKLKNAQVVIKDQLI